MFVLLLANAGKKRRNINRFKQRQNHFGQSQFLLLLRNLVLRKAKVFKNLALWIGVCSPRLHRHNYKRFYLDHQEKYSALAAKHLAGQASPAEEQDLLAWADANPDHQKLLGEWTQAWAMTEGAAASPFEADLGAAWAKVDAAISDLSPREGDTLTEQRPPTKVVRLSKIVRRWSVAAAVLFAVAAATWWFNRQPEQPQLVEIQTFAKEKRSVTLLSVSLQI